MNKIVNRFLLDGDTAMLGIEDNWDFPIVFPEHFRNIKIEYKKLKKQEIRDIFIQNELDKALFQYDMAHADFKDLSAKTASDKLLRDKVFNIASNSKYYVYQEGLASMGYNFFN